MAPAESEKEATVLVSGLGEQLSAYKTCPNKDTLVKLLKQAATALPKLKQSSVLKSNIKPLSDSLVKHDLLQNKDKDIKLLVAICFCEIIRVLAPDPGFDDAVFRDIFALLLSIFAELDDIASPYFSRRVKLLETVVKLRFCVLMLDIGCDKLVLKMFKTFFGVVREQHPHSMISAMSSLMTHILEEKLDEQILGQLTFEDKFSEPLLDVILQNLLKEEQGASAASFQLAVSVIQKCNQKLECFISTFLRSCIMNSDIIGSKVKESCHEIIFEIFQCAPHILLTVIPSLANELTMDQVDVRIKALHLIRRLFALPGSHVAQQYHHLFLEFLNRFADKSSEVRLCAISCAKGFYMHNSSGTETLQVLSALENRLLDFDDRIRTEALTVLCELARSNLKNFPIKLISRVAERLRDKKVSVRKKTLQKLLEVYQEYCRKCSEGVMTLSDQFEQIPCKTLMLCYDKDCKEFRPQIMDAVLAEDLFPASLSIKERCLHWIFAFSLFGPLHKKAFNSILSQKRRLRTEMQNYLDIRNNKENLGLEELEKRIKVLIGKMSASFPDPVKAEESFQKLHIVKDKRIFHMLEELLNAETTVDIYSTKDEVLRKIGERNSHVEFLQLLSTKCSLNIFSFQHVHCILDYLSSQRLGNKHLEDSPVQLLLSIINAFPSLLRGSEEQLLLLLSKDIIPFNEQLMHILVREGTHSSIKLSDVYSSLERVCLEGTRAQAKIAVSVLTAFGVSSEKFSFSILCKRLVDALHMRQSIPTVLQALGGIAQHSTLTSEAQEIACHILEEIFQVTDVGSSNGLNLCRTSKYTTPCKWMIYALKALVRSFLPHRRTDVNRRIDYLLEIILQLLCNGGFPDKSVVCDTENGEIRLAAAKSVLRLSRKWDLHISPEIFRLTVLMAKDNDPQVRRLFLNKLHKLVKSHSIPSRYACAFSFATSDSDDDLRENAFKSMEEFLRVYSKAAQLYPSSANSENVINHPVYMAVFLLHVIAHNTDFSPMECQDEEVYFPIFSPLLFTIQALVKANFADGGMGMHNSNASYLQSIFAVIRRAEDSIDHLVTQRLHTLAEIGLSVLNALQCKSISMSQKPELILLPSSLYKMSLTEDRQICNTSLPIKKFDEGFITNFVRGLGIQISQAPTNNEQGKHFHEDSLLNIPNKGSKLNFSLSKRVDTSGSPIKEQCKNPTSCQELHESLQDICATGPKNQANSSFSSKAVKWLNEFSVDDDHEDALNGAHDLTRSKQHPSFDTATTRSVLGPREDLSSPSKSEMIKKCNSNISDPSYCTRINHVCKSSGINDDNEALTEEHMKLKSSTHKCDHSGIIDGLEWRKCSRKDSSKTRSRYWDPREHSSVSSEKERLDAFGGNSLKKKRDFGSRENPWTANKKKEQNPQDDDVHLSASEIINVSENAIGRRLRRRKT